MYKRIELTKHIKHIASSYHNPRNKACLLIIELGNYKLICDLYGADCWDHLMESVITASKGIEKVISYGQWDRDSVVILLNSNFSEFRDIIAPSLTRSITNIERQIKEVCIFTGFAEYLDGETWQEWFNRTDKLLYKDKCNRVNNNGI
ncbi:diguanylate cyclase domain-containing protein [Vibrio astriarenae]